MRGRLLLALLPILLMLWLGIGIYLLQRHHSDIDGAQRDARNLSHAFEENIRRTIDAIDTTIRAVRVARAREGGRFDLGAWERDSGLTRELTLQISLVDRQGDVVVTNLDKMTGKRASIADREHFRVTRDTAADTLFISRPVLGRVSNRWSVQFVRKVFDADGAFDGVIVASLDPAFLSRFYTSLDIGRGALLLLGQDGIVRSGAPDTAAMLGDDLSESRLMTGAAVAPHGTVRMTGSRDGVERILSWRRAEPHGLVVVVGISIEDALIGFRRDRKIGIAIGAGLTGLILLVSAVLARNRRDVVQSREILQAAVENISQGLLVVDARRRVPVLNARAAELLELPPHLTEPGIEFDSLLEWQIDSGEFSGYDDAEVRKLVESGGIEGGNSVYRRRRRSGTVLEIRTKVLGSGLAVRTLTDITEQERAAEVLADARDAAEAAARARSEFLAVMSHEIRTPLNGVIGVAGLLEGMELGAAQREYVRLIHQSGDHLLELINDILDFSRLDAERMELEAVDFDPDALVQGALGMFLPQASAKGLVLTATAGVPMMVTGDPGRLRQILINLVSNAVKFTDRGQICVTMAHQVADEGCVRLVFSVADTGIGINPNAIDWMFEAFTQVDGSISRRFGGSGLGLAICRRLVELMGGSISVRSEPGVGSVFGFDVTLRVADAALPAGVPDAEPLGEPRLRILLAEDNDTNRLVALRMLERLGHRADAVGNGIEAIAASRLHRYDLILMDVMMPEMDGLTATREIRAAGRAEDRIPIVGLTARSGIESMAACLDAGMDVATTKPVTLATLRAAITQGREAARLRETADRSPDGGAVTFAAEPAQVRGARSSPIQSEIAHPLSTQVPDPTPARLAELAEMLGPEAAMEIVEAFAEDTWANLRALRQSVDDADVRTVHRLAHSIAGAARNVGADTLGARAGSLEENVGSMTGAAIEAAITAMEAEFDHVRDGLAHHAASVAVPF